MGENLLRSGSGSRTIFKKEFHHVESSRLSIVSRRGGSVKEVLMEGDDFIGDNFEEVGQGFMLWEGGWLNWAKNC